MIPKPLKATKQNITQLEDRGRSLAAYGEAIALGLLIVTVALINLAWLRQDTRPQPFTDPYPHRTLLFIDTLGKHGETGLWESIADLSIDGRSPLFQLLAVPFILLFGRSMDAALTVNMLFGALLLVCTYGIGTLALNGKAGLLAAFLVATYPPIVNLSKLFRPEFALAACVALSLWLLLLLLKTRSVQVAWLFGASLGFGMLIRHFFLFHLSVPTAVFGMYMLLFQTHPRLSPSFKETPRWLLAKLRDPFVLRGLLPAALIAAGLTAAWYLSSAAAPLLTLQQKIQGVDETVIRGFGDVASHSIWWYALTAPGAISYVFTAVLAAGLVLGMVRRDLASSVLVVAFVASYVFHGLQAGVGWKRFGSALPIAAALTSVGIVGIRHRRLGTALSLGCIAVAVFNFAVVTWGVEPWSRSVAAALGAPLDAGTGWAEQSDMASTGTSLAFDTCSWRINTAFCPNAPRNEDWRTGDILQSILNDAECHEHTCDLTIVSKNENFSASVFDFCRIRDFAQQTLKVRDLTAWRSLDYTLNWLLSDYVVYIPQWSSDSYAEAVTRFLESPPDLFDDSHQRMASYSLPGGQTASLIKRTKPLTVQEAEAVIAALNLPSEERAYLLQQFAPLRVRELLDEGSVAEAVDLAMQLLDGDTLNSREKAAQAVSIGNQLLNMGETARAIDLLNQVAPESDNALVWVLLGRAYAGQQNRIEAISAYEQALALDPQNYWANHLLAGLYAYREEWDAVVQLERAALQVATDDSHRVASAMRLVEAYESLGDRENACAVLQQIEQWAEEGDGRTEELRERLGCPP